MLAVDIYGTSSPMHVLDVNRLPDPVSCAYGNIDRLGLAKPPSHLVRFSAYRSRYFLTLYAVVRQLDMIIRSSAYANHCLLAAMYGYGLRHI